MCVRAPSTTLSETPIIHRILFFGEGSVQEIGTAMSPREKFQFELLRLIITYHNDRRLKSDEMLGVMKEMVADAEVAMGSSVGKKDDWFEEWMNRQAS